MLVLHVVFVVFSSLEQYDTYVKFSHDQISKRLAESAFSCKFRILGRYRIYSILLQMCLDAVHGFFLAFCRIVVISGYIF